MGYNVKILTPSHGFELFDEHEELYIYRDPITNDILRIYSYRKPRVEHIVFDGGLLSYPEVYSPKYLLPKVLQWARVIKYYALMELDHGIKPVVIHGNDWHSVPAMILLNNLYTSISAATRFYYQIHLLSRTKLGYREITDLLGTSPDHQVRGAYGIKSIREYYELSRGYVDRLGALLADKVLTVSRDYLREVLRRIGLDLESRADYIPNATTWNLDDVLPRVCKIHGEIASYCNRESVLGRERKKLREYLLLKALGRLGVNEPVIEDPETRELLKRVDYPPFRGDGKVEAFSSDGPLVLVTGRVSRQKGLHILAKSLDLIVSRLPSIRVLFVVLPVWGSIDLVRELIELSIIYRENVRVVFGKVPSIYELAYIACDVTAVPSIYEPFGLVALEAMAMGAPAVVSRTGGLAETVLDIREYGAKGTGMHVKPGDYEELAAVLTDALLYIETVYHTPWTREWYKLVNSVENNVLGDLLLSNPNAPLLNRRSSIIRASEYSWKSSASKAIKIYGIE